MWKKGALKVRNSIFKFCIKQYDVGSPFGIDNDLISKLSLKRDGVMVCCYDRGWYIQPIDDDTKTALEMLKHEYN